MSCMYMYRPFTIYIVYAPNRANMPRFVYKSCVQIHFGAKRLHVRAISVRSNKGQLCVLGNVHMCSSLICWDCCD